MTSSRLATLATGSAIGILGSRLLSSKQAETLQHTIKSEEDTPSLKPYPTDIAVPSGKAVIAADGVKDERSIRGHETALPVFTLEQV
jgi:hypothetical protein